MSGQYCFLCASDEGIFLDVTQDNQELFNKQLETCLSIKINDIIELSNKICYKCAYELDQCSKFIQKCKKSHENTESTEAQTSKPHCCLCVESVENGRIFDITKDNRSIFSPLQKIRFIFNQNFCKNHNVFKLICLTCRYNLDVSYDLKKLHQETVTNLKALINEELDYSSFPKVHTVVVNRKTTVTSFPDITFYESVSCDSDSSCKMTRSKPRTRKRNSTTRSDNDVRSKFRRCDGCFTMVSKDQDMYRFHHTGLTVCKNCWITIDPSKGKMTRRSRNSITPTKFCTVFLKDVMRERSRKKGNMYKVEKDKDGNNLYIIMDESSHDEEKGSPSVSFEDTSCSFNGKTTRGTKRRLHNVMTSDAESTPSKTRKQRMNVKNEKSKAFSDMDLPSNSFATMRKRKAGNISNKYHSSDSDIIIISDKETGPKRIHLSSNSEMEDVNRTNRKKLKSILKGVTAKMYSELNDESCNQDNTNVRRRTRSTSQTSSTNTNKTEIENEKELRKTKSSFAGEIIAPSPDNSQNSELVISSETKTEYTCDKCNSKFNNKLTQAKHRLTHFKQITLKLEKLSIPSNEQKESTKINSLESETMSRTANEHVNETQSGDKNIEDPTEEIAMNIDDDTDTDEEIFHFSQKLTERKENEEKDGNTGDDINDKSEAEKTKLNISMESIESENDKEASIEASQLCKDSTDRSEDIVATSAEYLEKDETKKKENVETLSVDEVDVSKDKNDHTQEAIVATTDNRKDLDAEENKDAKAENDTEEPATECNNSEEKSDDDATCGSSKTTEPSVSSTKNNNLVENYAENRDEIIKNNLGSNCENNENETAKDAEVEQNCDLMNDSEEKDIKESEEEKEIATGISNESETLNNSEESNNLIEIVNSDKVADSETMLGKIDEQDTQIETVIEVDKYDNAKSSNVNKDDVISISTDNSDDDIIFAKSLSAVKCHDKIMMNNSTEKKISIKKANDIKLLIENSTTCEVEEIDKRCEVEETNEIIEEKDTHERCEMEETDERDELKEVDRNSELQETDKKCEVQETNKKREVPKIDNESEVPKTDNESEVSKIDNESEVRETNNECKVQGRINNESQENTNNDITNTADEILKEVFDLAAAEVQKREESSSSSNNSNSTQKLNDLNEDTEVETLENISREIRNSADMPSLDPISVIDNNDDTLNQ